MTDRTINKSNPVIPDIVASMPEGERRLPIYLLLDTSGSMAGAPIEAVRRGLEQFKMEVQSDTIALETVWIGIITFGGRAEFTTGGLIPFHQFVPPVLSAAGQTPLGEAFLLLIRSIDIDLKRPIVGGHKGDWRPLIFILTDGEPTDSWQKAREELLQRKRKKVLRIITVGCGPYINEQNLKNIAIADTSEKNPSAEPSVFIMDNDTASFGKFFKWVSTMVGSESKACSQSGISNLNNVKPPSGMQQVLF